MMIPEKQLAEAVKVLRHLGATRVVLFGSFAEEPKRARDCDIAVEGIPLTRILEADAAVYDVLRQPVDLVSREENSSFYDIVTKRGKVLYERDQSSVGRRGPARVAATETSR